MQVVNLTTYNLLSNDTQTPKQKVHTYIYILHGISDFLEVNILDYFLMDGLAGNKICFVYQNYYLQKLENILKI
jgi:hypothetical protein